MMLKNSLINKKNITKTLYILLFIPLTSFASLPKNINCTTPNGDVLSWIIKEKTVEHIAASNLGVFQNIFKITRKNSLEVKFNGMDKANEFTVSDLMWNVDKQTVYVRSIILTGEGDKLELSGGYIQNFKNCLIK